MRFKPLMAAAAALAICAPVSAKNPARGWFVGADVGPSHLVGNVEFEDGGPVDFDETSMAYTLHAGYRFSRFLSLGINYSDYGDFSINDPDLAVDASVKAMGVNFVARIPLNQRIGLRTTASVQYRDLDMNATSPGEQLWHQGNRGLVTRLALGFGYKFSDHLDACVDYSTLRDVGYVFMQMGNASLQFRGRLDAITAGLRYKF